MTVAPTDPAAAKQAGEWESEGGALKAKPPQPLPDGPESLPEGPDSLPEGIVAIPATRYRVGDYSYTKLDDALAELRRQTPE